MTLSGTESGVEALSDRDLLQYESYTTRARATLLPPTAFTYVQMEYCRFVRYSGVPVRPWYDLSTAVAQLTYDRILVPDTCTATGLSASCCQLNNLDPAR